MSEKGKREVSLQVLICSYGEAGIHRIAAGEHPAVEGVEYLVSWQTDTEVPIPAELERPDFRVFIHRDKGLSRNRNHALGHSSAPLLLLADDDLHYTREGLLAVINAFKKYPEADLLTFRHSSDAGQQLYPEADCPLAEVPRGYFPISFEIAFRREKVVGRFSFNPHFGVGSAIFGSGEEDMFYHSMLRSGLCGRFVASTICFHPGPTTAFRSDPDAMTEDKGGVFLYLHPIAWPAYMLSHALRAPRGKRLSYCRHWLRGMRKARRLRVFE